METRKRPRGERTTHEIIKAAHALFAEQGYHGTSMRQIADRAGISLSGIYNHFSSKEEIFKRLIIEYHPISDILPEVEQVQGKSVPETVCFTSQTMQSTLAKRGDYINLLMVELIEFRGQHVSTVFEEIFPRALALAQKLLQGKQLRFTNIPLMFMSFLALNLVFFAVNRFLSQGVIGKLVKLDIHQVMDIFLYGILEDSQEVPS